MSEAGFAFTLWVCLCVMEIIMLATKIQLLYELLIHIHILGVKKDPVLKKEAPSQRLCFVCEQSFKIKVTWVIFKGRIYKYDIRSLGCITTTTRTCQAVISSTYTVQFIPPGKKWIRVTIELLPGNTNSLWPLEALHIIWLLFIKAWLWKQLYITWCHGIVYKTRCSRDLFHTVSPVVCLFAWK